ncbi:hypothetical protein CPB84DRAFT_1774010 [Gymnopilus junonius]|uniref:Uncharacterized protein n=1 Tax=Gymnopilus junonius TaxID=109634 RepID=A0A9P5NRA5_GYMJU|nr:hypothetical protein CPB84DRAFT_1774010 [Gymnopilus junonius]
MVVEYRVKTSGLSFGCVHVPIGGVCGPRGAYEYPKRFYEEVAMKTRTLLLNEPRPATVLSRRR